MPHRKNSVWPSILCFPLGVAGALVARYAVLLPWLYSDLVARHPGLQTPFLAEGIPGLVHLLAQAAGIGAALFLTVSIAALLVRNRWTLWLLRKGYVASYLLFWFYAYVVFKTTGLIQSANLPVDGVLPDSMDVFHWRCALIWKPLAAAVGLTLLYLLSWRRAAIRLYTGETDDSPAIGDRIIEDIRTHGHDPVFRKSVWSSVGAHIMVILVVPWLLSFWGCVEPYRVPKGSGTPEVSAARIVKVEKKKKKKKVLVNPQSAISFHVPDLDDSPLLKQVEEMTQLTYMADPNRVLAAGTGGKMGVGGGKTGGWPDGMDKSLVRLIRMEYDGPGWDDGMDAVSRADMNFLDAFRKMTGFNTARQSESHPISWLRKYRKGFAPPFVYMTGSGQINVSAQDLKILRQYLYDGGMLFADCGSGYWDRNFRTFVRNLCPGEPLLVVADDDPLFQVPFSFPNGAPPLWHHGGMRAMGIKHKGRWIVFYHPGDINDAWKTGSSGMDPRLASGAIEMGVNIIYYSFTHYLELTRAYRK